MSLLNLQIPLYRIHRSSFSPQSFKQTHSSTTSPSKFLCLASSSNPYSSEEARWLREEQRWLREEQRWLRQESLWITERESLQKEISELKLKIQKLEAEREYRYPSSVPETLSRIATLLQALKESTVSPASSVSAEVGEIITASSFSESIASVSDNESLPAPSSPPPPTVVEQKPNQVVNKKKTEFTRRILKRGSEGDEVLALQEALMELGFYCGEEDMEYSSFDSGTERAVKTWQSSLGIKEDGIMTSDLLDSLFNNTDPLQSENSSILKNQNGAVAASSNRIAEEKFTKTQGSNQVEEISRNRVYLLGENRWEDSSRLTIGNDDKQASDAKACYNCRGEGRVMCIECDGSGESNAESQFVEWVDEGANCPYCDGLGYTICDACVGKTAA